MASWGLGYLSDLARGAYEFRDDFSFSFSSPFTSPPVAAWAWKWLVLYGEMDRMSMCMLREGLVRGFASFSLSD